MVATYIIDSYVGNSEGAQAPIAVNFFMEMVGPEGLEPSTKGFTVP